MISSSDWKIQLWDLMTTKISRTLGQADMTTCIAWSPDGKYLATTGKRDRLWNLAISVLEKILTQKQDSVASFSASFSPDSTKLTVSYKDARTRIWDVASGQLLDTFKDEHEIVFSVRYSPYGRTLMTKSIKGFDRSDPVSVFFAVTLGSDVSIWKIASRSKLELYNGICLLQPHNIAFSPNARTVVARVNKGVVVWIGNEE